MLVDTHCHLGDEAFDTDRDAVLRRAAAAGVAHVVIVAESLATTHRARNLATTYRMSATAGVHPHVADTWNPDTAARVRDALRHPEVVAVGETGLDYHYEHAPRDVQRHAFEAHLTLGAELGLPVVVHARDADEDMAAMLTAWGADVPAVILHSFSSGTPVLDAGLSVGAYFSFSGMVTFKNWRSHNSLAACPPDRLMVETDAPYLAPVPHRGKRNEPAFVAAVAAQVAALRDSTPAELASLTTANATRCFGDRVSTPQPDPS